MSSCDCFAGNFWSISLLFGLLKQEFGGHIFHNTVDMEMAVHESGECKGLSCMMTKFLNACQEGAHIYIYIYQCARRLC